MPKTNLIVDEAAAVTVISLKIIIIIIIMGLESVSASEDVIGDLPSPWFKMVRPIHNKCGNPGRRGKEKVGTLAESVIPCICPD